MSREVRRVPKDWFHPHGRVLFGERFEDEIGQWIEGEAKWAVGMVKGYGDAPKWIKKSADKEGRSFEDWAGERPQKHEYMPSWSDEERTHYQMYETTSEGSPISPVMESPEELAQWLVDNAASSFAGQTASYDAWLRIAQGGWAPTAVMQGGVIESGVEALKEERG